MHDLSERLKRLRLMAGVKNRELDRLAGITGSHSHHIENGHRINPTLATLDAIAKALGCSVGWLAKGEGKEPSATEVATAIKAARQLHAAGVESESDPAPSSAAE